ncbi:sensor histidine kinase [Paraurantiacibacter namhicola]|uniref:histidine kinase n=1 Tax=Paraurantiacibacter namhicola TaxID=645517 RepID=A0A1C7D6M0_9SPHN|nr:PAS domain-containing protein [Paraurantiacibacter namhicola]ANU06971.1 Blue-light-activated histidine kinase 1 [Paraurantiacibacter namhicola]
MKNPVHLSWPTDAEPAPEFCGEDARMGVLRSFDAEAFVDDPELQAIVRYAAEMAGVPTALVTLVDEERQVFIAREGLEDRETPRELSFCAHAMLIGRGMTVEDAREDPRFADNPLVTGAPHVRFYHGQPLISGEGAPLGALCLVSPDARPGGLDPLQRKGVAVMAQAVMGRLERRRTAIAVDAELEERDARFRDLADSIPDIAWTAKPDGTVTFMNRRWFEYTGRTDFDPQLAARNCVHPDDFSKMEAARAVSLRDGTTFEFENRLLRHDGAYRWMITRAVPITDDSGAVVRWFGTITDIHAAHSLSESRDLLAKELSHRIKNIFAVITGLISLNVRKQPEHKPFADELIQTLRALGRAHEYVRPTDRIADEKDTLQGMFSDLFAPYGGGTHARVKVSGDDVPIGPRAATPLALIFHELATNSAKYGALAQERGDVDITLREEGDTVIIRWDENGVLHKPDTEHEGFGSRLVDMSVRGQLDGEWERRFGEDGLEVTLRLSRAALNGQVSSR